VKNYVVYNEQGDIVKTGHCVDGDLSLQAGVGETVIEGILGEGAHHVVDGLIVAKPAPSDSDKTTLVMEQVRRDRDLMLSSTDWTQVPDSPLTAEQRSEWQMYRQRLRDLPSDYSHVTSLEDVVWPDPPS